MSLIARLLNGAAPGSGHHDRPDPFGVVGRAVQIGRHCVQRFGRRMPDLVRRDLGDVLPISSACAVNRVIRIPPA